MASSISGDGPLFQSAPPCGGRRKLLSLILRWTLSEFQSAPPCGGRPRADPGATAGAGRVSIRAPVRGATPGVRRRAGRRRFNPRPRAGGDAMAHIDEGVYGLLFQSAPPCGGRHTKRLLQLRQLFQSAPPCGGRLCRSPPPLQRGPFQSAPPCGGRRAAGPPPRPRARDRFNPRPRAGGDTADDFRVIGAVVSIRAPVRGATPRIRITICLSAFQSAPPCGGRLRQRIA